MRALRRARPSLAFFAFLAWLLVAVASAAAGDEKEHDYVGFQKCRSCHEKDLMGDQVGVWSKGPHHRAYDSLLGEASGKIARELGIEGPAHESDACLRCHVTAFGVSPLRLANPMELGTGVQCEACHGPGRDYRKKKIMADRKEAERKGLWNAGRDGAICTGCHNSESPTYDPSRYTLPDGSTTGFDFELAKGRIPHAIPEDVKGHFIELEEAEKAAEKAKKAGE